MTPCRGVTSETEKPSARIVLARRPLGVLTVVLLVGAAVAGTVMS